MSECTRHTKSPLTSIDMIPADHIPRAFSTGGTMASRVAARLRELASRQLGKMPPLVPPLEFPCRVVPIAEGSATLNNDIYRDPELVQSWHAADRTQKLSTLHLLNAARIPFFDRVWSQQLGLGPDRTGNFLEVGCGGGVATCALARRGYAMTGVDPAPESLEAAREHAQREGIGSRTLFAEGSAYDLSSFPDGAFDGVVMADVLEHLYDLPAAIDQVWRCLRPGGVLVFDTINRTYASYLLTIAIAQEAMGVVPEDTHDWRMYVKPHEIAFLLQASTDRHVAAKGVGAGRDGGGGGGGGGGVGLGW